VTKIQVSRSMASREAKGKLKTACPDSHRNFGVLTKWKLAVIETQKISLINRHFWIEYVSHYNTQAKKACKLYEFCTFSPKIYSFKLICSKTRIQSQIPIACFTIFYYWNQQQKPMRPKGSFMSMNLNWKKAVTQIDGKFWFFICSLVYDLKLN